MRANMKLNIAYVLLFSLFVSTPLWAADNSDPKVVADKVQAQYNQTKDFKGKFKQVFTDALYNRKRVSFGYLWVKKPGMMRWNYVQPEKKSFISDGKILWVYEPVDKQAFRNPLSTKTLSTGLAFLLGTGNLGKEFNVSFATDKKEKLGSPQHIVLKLVPKKKTAQYDHLILVVRPSDYAVEESMVVSKHNTNHFIFSELNFNSGVQTWRFKFKAPEGVRVVDSSKMGKR